MAGELILVIDDSNAIVSLLTEEILPHSGFKAAGARTGAQGIQALSRVQPALVLLDFELPDMTGLDVLQQMRDTGFTMPTLLMTAYGSEAIAAQALRLGVRDYLIKPLTADEVIGAINKALTEHRLRAESNAMHEQLGRLNRVLIALQNVGATSTSRAELDDVLTRCVDASLFVTGGDNGFLALLEDGTSLTIRVARNVAGAQGRCIALAPDDPFVRLLRQGRPHRRPADGSTPAVLHVPLAWRGAPTGVLSVTGRPAGSEFGEQDERAVAAIGHYVALALENARLREAAAAERAGRASSRLSALGIKGGNAAT